MTMEDKKDDKSESDRQAWTETVRQLALTGLATFFMTEEAVRATLKDLKLPKELLSLLLEGISKKKDDFYGLLVKEFGQILARVELGKELGQFLERHHIQFEAKISFEPKRKEEP